VGLKAGLDDMEKRKFLTLYGPEIQPLGRPARSQSLYRLRYRGSAAGQLQVLLRSRSYEEHLRRNMRTAGCMRESCTSHALPVYTDAWEVCQ
jgi:hypothetical protein